MLIDLLDLQMDSRDSSSSVAVASNRETASFSPEDDGSLSVTAALAKEAALLFQSAKFSDCRKVLNQLLQMKEGDPKVLHNIAVVENFQEGLLNPKKFLEVLNNVKYFAEAGKMPSLVLMLILKLHKNYSEELAHASGEHLEAVSDSVSIGLLGSNGNNAVGNKSSITSISTVVLNGEFSTYVALFNIAVTWFHLHEYSNSFSSLETLYQNIAHVNGGTALRICLLLLDVALLSNNALISADVINYIEKVSYAHTLASQGDNGSAAQQQLSSLFPKTSSATSNAPIPDVSTSDSTSNASESPLSRSLSEEAEYENFFSTLDSSGQNLSRPSILHPSNDLSRTQFDDSFPIADLRLKLHLYKVRFLLLARNPKAAKHEVKMALNVARGKEYSMALFLKAQLEYARGNHRKAVKLLMASSNLTETTTSIMYYNNLGCIYDHLGRHRASIVFFSKALSSCSSLRKERPQAHTTFVLDKSFLIVYNCGVQYLACGEPKLAARCFHKASLIFYDRPLLWLRIAECCLMALEKGLLESSGNLVSRQEARVHVVGKGKWRNLVMEDEVSRHGQVDSASRKDSFLDADITPKLSMHLARQCLLNALHLLNSSGSRNFKSGLLSKSAPEQERVFSKNTNKIVAGGDSLVDSVAVDSQVGANGELKEQKSGNSLNGTLQSSVFYYEEVCKKENQMIRLSVLADLAFVELELGNPLKAVSSARALLKVPECSGLYRFLGNMYAAEALCLLNRSKEAAEHLLIYLSSGDNFEHPYTQEDCELWRAKKTVVLEESNGGAVAANSSLNETLDFAALNPEEACGTLFANLAAMSAIQGDLDQANRFVIKALSIIPNSLGANLTAIYLDLMRGKPYDAIVKLKQCILIRFVSSNVSVNGSS